tara:strand:- start:533 stop:985 length:453 start_codon:yes stop_codon:yes gene_type:complete
MSFSDHAKAQMDDSRTLEPGDEPVNYPKPEAMPEIRGTLHALQVCVEDKQETVDALKQQLAECVEELRKACRVEGELRRQIRTRHCAGYDVVAVNRPNEPTVRHATKPEAEAAAVEWLLNDGYDSAEQSPSEFLDAHADVVQVREGRVAE